MAEWQDLDALVASTQGNAVGSLSLRELRVHDQMIRALVTAMEDGTVDFARQHESFTAEEYAEFMDCTQQAANNRLVKLYDNHLLDRERMDPKRGGKRFRYLPRERLLYPGAKLRISQKELGRSSDGGTR